MGNAGLEKALTHDLEYDIISSIKGNLTLHLLHLD